MDIASKPYTSSLRRKVSPKRASHRKRPYRRHSKPVGRRRMRPRAHPRESRPSLLVAVIDLWMSGRHRPAVSRSGHGMSRGHGRLTGRTRLLLFVGLQVAALDVPFIALPLERVRHRDGLRCRGPLWLETDFRIGFFLTEGDGIDIDIHGLYVDFLGDVLEHSLLHRFGCIDVFGATGETQRGEADRSAARRV